MPLNFTEQLAILQNDVSPTSDTLRELVQQIAIAEARNFRDTYKNFDEEGNPLALAYVNKITKAVAQSYGLSTGAIESITAILIAIYSINGDYATVQAATDVQWAGFLQTNMMEAFEEFTRVTRAEKDAYTNVTILP